MDGLSADLRCARSGGFNLQAQFTAGSGRITGICGPSAAGKTTLLRCLAGLQPEAQGSIRLNDTTWLDSGAGLQVPAHQRSTGYAAQHDDLFPHLDVAGNLALAGGLKGDTARQVIDGLGIAPLLGKRPAGLSGGQAQRVRLARAMLRMPRLLLLDEPLNMLDLGARGELLRFLQHWAAEHRPVVLFTSHAPEDIAQCAAEAIRIEAGRVVAHGPVAQVLNDPGQARRAGAHAGSLLLCQATAAGAEHGLTPLRIEGLADSEALWVVHPGGAAGVEIRLYVHARDVSLARTRATDSSIQNILPARVADIAPGDGAVSLVALEVGAQRLYACVTQRALAHLQLETGDRVYAQIKSVSLLD